MISVFIFGFVTGFIVSDMLVAKMARFFSRSNAEPIREATRNFAHKRGINLQEKGRVVKLANYDALDAFDEAENVLDALDKVTHEPAE